MSRGGRLADKALFIAVGSGIQSVGNAAISIFLTRLFPDQETFGSYRQVWLVFQTLLPLFLLGLPHAIYFFFGRLADGERRAFMSRALWTISASGLLFSLGLFCGAEFIARTLSSPSVAPVLRAFSLYPLFVGGSMLLFPFLVSSGRHERAVLWNTGFFLVQSALIVVMVWRSFSLEKLFASLVVLAFLRLVGAVWEIWRAHRSAPYSRLDLTLRETLSYSLPVGLSTVTTFLGQRIDRFVVSAALGTEVFAVYSVGAVEFPIITILAMAANTVMRPRIAEFHHGGEPGRILSFWREAFRKQALVMVPSAVFLFLFAPEMITWLYTSDYIGAVPVFQLYLGLALFRNLNYPLILTSTGSTRVVLLGTVAFLVFNLALNLVLIGPMGQFGPPVATLIAMGLLSVYYVARVATQLEVPWPRLVPLATWFRILMLAVVSGVAVLWVRRLGYGNFGTLALAGVLFAPLYLVLASLSRALVADDRRLILGWLRLRR